MLTGNTIHGFTVISTRPLAELGATMYRLRHGRTGLEAVWLSRPEANRTFGIAFPTLPEDDTGVFHILEHSVLCGSERYPLREPFVELMKGSMNTFLNAMTFPDKTFYPISSRNPKDFINLMRVYLDAVFRPLIYSKPEIFRQEGWHYELDGEGRLSYNGVVYNEMRGCYADVDELETHALMASLFPDTPYRFESGGAPESIPSLSFEAFLAAHRRWYSPSNAYVYLDGDIDIDEALGIIDGEYLSGAERTERVAPPAPQSPVRAEPKRVVYELAESESEENRYRLAWGAVAGSMLERERLAAEALCTLLCGDNQSPLCRAVLSEGLAEGVSMMLWDGCAQPFLRLEVTNARESDLGRVREVLRSELEALAGGALDRARLEAVLANLEFRMRERDYGYYPQGLVLGFDVLDSWLRGGDPAARLEIGRLFETLRARMADGWFERLIRELLLDNPHFAEAVMVPSHSCGDERRAAEAGRLAAIAGSWGEERRERQRAEMAALEAFQNSVDSPEDLARLPRLTLADLSAEPEAYPTAEEELSGAPLLRHELGAGGISYFTAYFDVTGLTAEELPALSFLCALLGKVDTERRPAEELSRLTQLYCGSMSFGVNVYERPDGSYALKLAAHVSCLEQRAAEAFGLLGEILTGSRLTDERAVLDILRQTRAESFQNLVNNGHNVSVGRVAAMFTPGAAAGESVSGFGYYRWLKDAETGWDFKALSAGLERLRGLCVNRAALTLSLTGERSAAVDAAAAAFVDALPERERLSGPGVRALGTARVGIEIPSDVGYAALGARYGAFDGGRFLAGRILSLGYLWNAVRVRGGAYGTGMVTRYNGYAGCYSYRDPTPAKTLEAYAGCADALEALAASGECLEGYIIGAVSAEEPLLTARAKGFEADSLYFRGVGYELRRRNRLELLGCTCGRLAKLAGELRAALAGGGVCVLAQRDELESCSLDEIYTL